MQKMVVPSQSCIRCRSRRMKCDLRLPKCGSCRSVGAECLTLDPGLDENVDRRYIFAQGYCIPEKYTATNSSTAASYVYSLQKRVQALENQIRTHQEAPMSEQYVSLQDKEASPQSYDYIGLGTSVSLFEQLCYIPLLFSIHSTAETPNISVYTPNSGIDQMSQPLLLPVSADDSAHLLTPAVQRSLMKCFFERVSPELPPILPKESEEILLQDVDPLSTFSKNSNPWLRAILFSVYAVSAHLVSTDFHAEYAYLERICLNELDQVLSETSGTFNVCSPYTLDQVTVLCLGILHELVGPGRSRISRDVVNAAQILLSIVPHIDRNDSGRLESASRLALFLSQVEAYDDLIQFWYKYSN